MVSTVADAHQRGHDRDAELLGERTHRVGGTRVDDATARIDQRPLGFAEHVEEFLGVQLVDRVLAQDGHAVTVAADRQQAVALVGALPVLHVLRDVDHDGTGPAGARDLERGADGRLELGGDRSPGRRAWRPRP